MTESSSSINVLMVCTGNTCRSPMAAAFLRGRLAVRGVDASVHSAGFFRAGERATSHGVAVMAARGFDTSTHRSRLVSPDLSKEADLVVCMAREHVRKVVALAPDSWSRTFTLKELVRSGEQAGPRRPGETFGDYLDRLHWGRRPEDMLSASSEDDVADPIGGPRRGYEVTAAGLDDLTARLAPLLVPEVS
jgi:protein-tyrosine phosphatase